MAVFRGRTITQDYGVKNPIYRKGYHTGIDLDYRYEPVGAFYDGVVIEQGQDSSRGQFIVLQRNDGSTHHYYHLSAVHTFIGKGVAAGEVLGISGDGGLSSGPHLHYEIRINGQDIDPKTYQGGNMQATEIAEIRAQYLARIALAAGVNPDHPLEERDIQQVISNIDAKNKEIDRLRAQAGESSKWETLRVLLRELLGIK